MRTSNLKPLIAILSLPVFSFTAGQYLPYVIASVSGSGAIAAVPLAIFAVSTTVALISKIYLIRLAISRADNKKEEPQNLRVKIVLIWRINQVCLSLHRLQQRLEHNQIQVSVHHRHPKFSKFINSTE